MKSFVWLAVLTLVGLNLAPGPAAAADLNVGDKAPDFTLQATTARPIDSRSSRARRRVVLAWFPKAFTQGCTIECKSLAEHGDLIKKYNAKYFMASVDPLEGEEGNKAFAQAHKADFPLLSDPTKETAKAYGVLGDHGFANRWTFYVGKDGKILAIDKQVKPATSAQDIAATLKQLGVEERAK